MLRELNELEYLTLAVGQPFNIAVMLKINGNLKSELLKSTLKKLQNKHPLLRSRLIFDNKNRPWFTSENVGSIPLKEIKRKDNFHALNEFHKQLSTPFDIENKKLPLIRVSLISSPNISEIIICALHTISDGFSLIYLVRDLIKYMINPNEIIIPIDFPQQDVDLFTPKVRKMIPKTPLYAYFLYTLLRIYNFIRYVFVGKRKTAEVNIKENEMEIYSFNLTEMQTKEFLEKCKKEKITVHSAISTAFINEYPIIGSPVNLRSRLNHNIGESNGFYSGVAVFKKKYKKSISFWENARKLQKKLMKSLRDRKLFYLQKIFSKAVSLKLLRKIGTYYVELVSNKQPFSIDNLGSLDIYIQDLDLEKFPTIESFFGGITSFLNAFIVLFYTLRNEMYFYFHYTKSKYSQEEIRKYAEKIKDRLIEAIKK